MIIHYENIFMKNCVCLMVLNMITMPCRIQIISDLLTVTKTSIFI